MEGPVGFSSIAAKRRWVFLQQCRTPTCTKPAWWFVGGLATLNSIVTQYGCSTCLSIAHLTSHLFLFISRSITSGFFLGRDQVTKVVSEPYLVWQPCSSRIPFLTLYRMKYFTSHKLKHIAAGDSVFGIQSSQPRPDCELLPILNQDLTLTVSSYLSLL